jgi:hypothetical protein
MHKFMVPLLSIVPLALLSGAASAKGCLKGAAVGGVVGHVAGHHAAVGAAAGCVIEHHREKVQDRAAAKQEAASRKEPSAANSANSVASRPT